MELKSLAYISLLFLLAVIQVIFSLKAKTGFYSKARYWGPAVAITAILFLMWQINSVRSGICNFNPEYTIGIFRKDIPLEEWLYYLLVPYISVYVYEWVKTAHNKLDKNNTLLAISLFLMVVFGVVAYLFKDHYYTFFTFLFTAVYLAYTIFRNQFKSHLTSFYLTFLFVLIPVIIIDALLTGLPVVSYNPDHMIHFNILSIPIENVIRLYLMVLMTTTVYEFLEERKFF